MSVRTIRWAATVPPDERVIRQLFAAEGLQPFRWSNGPGDVYGAHAHGYDKVIYVVDGSITFDLPGIGESVALAAGDRLELGRGVSHSAVVGPRGVACLEAHR